MAKPPLKPMQYNFLQADNYVSLQGRVIQVTILQNWGRSQWVLWESLFSSVSTVSKGVGDSSQSYTLQDGAVALRRMLCLPWNLVMTRDTVDA